MKGLQIPHWKDTMLSFKLKYLNQKGFLSHIEKTWLFSWEHIVYILMDFKSHIKKKKKRVSFGFARVACVWSDCCHSRSFIKPGPVQPPGRPGPGSTRRARPGLIAVISSLLVLSPKVAGNYYSMRHIICSFGWLVIHFLLKKKGNSLDSKA